MNMNNFIQPILFIGIANIAKRERNRGAKQLDALMKVRCYTINICCPNPPPLQQIAETDVFGGPSISGIGSSFERLHG